MLRLSLWLMVVVDGGNIVHDGTQQPWDALVAMVVLVAVAVLVAMAVVIMAGKGGIHYDALQHFSPLCNNNIIILLMSY